MKAEKVWKIEYTRVFDFDTDTSGWEIKMIKADTIEQAIEMLKTYSRQEKWKNLDIHTVEFSYQILIEEE